MSGPCGDFAQVVGFQHGNPDGVLGLSCQLNVTEDHEMLVQRGRFSRFGRATVLATVAAVALTAIAPSLAFAGAAPSKPGSTTVATDHGITDVSARRRHYRGGGGGGAAAAAAFAGIVGTGLAIAASQNRRSYYDDDYGRPYYGGQGYYSPQPYTQQPYYGSPYGGGW
jgi:hypothetical protein